MTSKLTREERLQALYDLKVGQVLSLADIENVKMLSRMALSAMDSEPVGTFRKTAVGYTPSYHEDAVALYRHPQPAPVAPVCTCPSGDGSLRWPCPVHPGNSPVIPDGWTCNDKANAALMMLDRIETADPVDDDRIDGIKRIVRELAAAPHDTPALNSVQSVVTVPGKWIPVSEQMPEREIDVQVYCPDKKEQMVAYLERNELEGYFRFATWRTGDGIYCQPTHWMPLPAAPQEGK